MLTHLFCDSTKPNTCEVVDGKSGVLRVVQGEHTTASPLDFIVLEALHHNLQTHGFSHLVEHDLDEDTATRRRVLFSQFDAFHDAPRDRIGGEKVSEEASDIPETVCFVAVDSQVVVCESTLKAFVPNAVQLAETLANEAVERRVRSLLRATLDDHFAQLDLIAP